MTPQKRLLGGWSHARTPAILRIRAAPCMARGGGVGCCDQANGAGPHRPQQPETNPCRSPGTPPLSPRHPFPLAGENLHAPGAQSITMGGAPHKNPQLHQTSALSDRYLHRQRRDRNAGKEGAQPEQILVFRPEGRTPLRDAVGLVDGEEPDRQAGERRQHALGHHPFRGHVEKPRPARRPPLGRHIGVPVVRGVDAVGGYARQPRGGQRPAAQLTDRGRPRPPAWERTPGPASGRSGTTPQP